MSQTTRRTFLKNSLAAGTAFIVCGTQSTKALGANDRLRIAVAGVNSQGRSHVDGWLGQKNVELAYLIDPDEQVLAQRLAYVKEKAGDSFACKGVADARKALEDKSLDAISIAAPNHWHSLITIWAAQAGKHVYVEKPMSHDVHEGPVVVEAQKKYGVVIQHGTQSRSGAKNAGLHDLIRSGKFGKMKISHGYCCKPRDSIGFKSPSAPPAHLDWNLWRGPARIPTFISITDGKVHDVNILDEILPEAGAFYVMDRGYVDFEGLCKFTLSSAFFVVRTKSNVCCSGATPRRSTRPRAFAPITLSF